MKFSIIIAAYNLGNLICEAIESCINQKGIPQREFEIIVINDGSKDDTLDYIRQYEDCPNLRILSQRNAGLSATRNKGIELSKGEYLLFLDGDDWLAENALAILSDNIEDNLLTIFPMIYYYDSAHQETRRFGLTEKTYSRDKFLHNSIGKSYFNIIPSPNKCYSRRLLTEHGIRFEEGILHEDNPFFLKVAYTYDRFRYIDEPIYYYRQNRSGSITASCTIKNFNGIMAGNDVIEKLAGHSNRDVNFLLANLHVFQVIGNYSKPEDRNKVFSYYRGFKTKIKLIRLMLKSTLRIKHCIRLILLIIDPALLKFVIKNV